MSEELPDWQRGYALEHLRAYADVFRASDEGYVLGAFTGFRERDVATALEAGQLYAAWSTGDDSRPVAAVVWREVLQRQSIKDFTGEVRARMQPGDVSVTRVGCLSGHEEQARRLLSMLALERVQPGASLWVQGWVESTQFRQLLERLPFHQVAVKIPASSELVGVWVASKGVVPELQPLPTRERWGLRRLAGQFPADALDAAVASLERVPAYAQHYSSYNRRHSWSALSLRGYSDDPGFIVKPAEMSKGWKAQNAAMLEAEVRDTPLRGQLPELERLLEAIPGRHQRVRLMRLDPGGGELTRHADITDQEAGTAQGHVLRIHIPLVSNPGAQFSSWDLDGRQYARYFRPGEAWYLDTRKPHTAINSGDSPRVHLVVDAYSSDELLHLLDLGE